MVNQFQLILLLPLVGTYMPNSILLFIEGMNTALLSMNFLSVQNIPFVNSFIKGFTAERTDKFLNKIGIQYESTIINQVNLIAIFI